jgi:DNA-binding Lrp family transcriptional regulator
MHCASRRLEAAPARIGGYSLLASAPASRNEQRAKGPIDDRYAASMAAALPLDSIDGRIVELLRENARRPFQDIGKRVGLSAPAVKRRVDRLEQRGIIRGYSAILDPAQLGWPTLAVVELYCDGRMAAEEVQATLSRHPEVAAAYTVGGAASAVVLLRATDTRHLEQALGRIREADGVLRTETSVVFSTLLERPFAFDASIP